MILYLSTLPRHHWKTLQDNLVSTIKQQILPNADDPQVTLIFVHNPVCEYTVLDYLPASNTIVILNLPNSDHGSVPVHQEPDALRYFLTKCVAVDLQVKSDEKHRVVLGPKTAQPTTTTAEQSSTPAAK